MIQKRLLKRAKILPELFFEGFPHLIIAHIQFLRNKPNI